MGDGTSDAGARCQALHRQQGEEEQRQAEDGIEVEVADSTRKTYAIRGWSSRGFGYYASHISRGFSKEGRMSSEGLFPFVIMSITYLLFTVTDGAVRMIVLFHAYNNGFSAMDVAVMFSFYELAGVVTNLSAGMLGARWGIKSTLLSGLTVQLIAFGMLFGWQESWTKVESIVYVTFSQIMSGVAKDLTKLGGKTVTKLVTPSGKDSRLFKLVSFITGFKNSLKGGGIFSGGGACQCQLLFVPGRPVWVYWSGLPLCAVWLVQLTWPC
jgi:hypothetical protein